MSSIRNIFRRGSRREDVYRLQEEPSEEVNVVEKEERSTTSLVSEDKRSGEFEKREERKKSRSRCASAGGTADTQPKEQHKEQVYHSFRRDVFTFFDIPNRHTVENLMNKCIPEWLRYLTKEHFQAKDLIPCEYRLGNMNFEDTFWFSFRLKQCATEDQRRVIEQLFGCQEGNYQLCDPEKLANMNGLIALQSDGAGMSFMKSLKTMTDADILKMETMRKGKERMEEKYSDSMYTITEDSYASFTIWTKDGPWRKFLRKYDFETFYQDDSHIYDEIVQPLAETVIGNKLLKVIDKEMETSKGKKPEEETVKEEEI